MTSRTKRRKVNILMLNGIKLNGMFYPKNHSNDGDEKAVDAGKDQGYDPDCVRIRT